MNIWVTSDHHFGHKNILKYEEEARPFQTIEEMHEVLIERWNSVVGPKDTVWHLGDFAFGAINISIADRLNGRKKLVLGNHDIYPTSEYLKYFEKLYGVIHYKDCVFSHIPVHPDSLRDRAFINVHGHLHSKRVIRSARIDGSIGDSFCRTMQIDPNYFNASVEQNNLTPVNFDIIKLKIERLKG